MTKKTIQIAIITLYAIKFAIAIAVTTGVIYALYLLISPLQ